MRIEYIPVGDNPGGVAFSPNGSRAYVTNRDAWNRQVISGTNLE